MAAMKKNMETLKRELALLQSENALLKTEPADAKHQLATVHAAAAERTTSTTLPFHFLDLPRELRNAIYELVRILVRDPWTCRRVCYA